MICGKCKNMLRLKMQGIVGLAFGRKEYHLWFICDVCRSEYEVNSTPENDPYYEGHKSVLENSRKLPPFPG